MNNLIGRIVTVLPLPIIWVALITTANAAQQKSPLTLDPTYGRAILKKAPETKHNSDAAWIWSKQSSDNQTVYARRHFLLNRVPHHAMLYVTADNEFVAYINGKRIGQTPSVPGDHDLWKKVQAVDVTPQLHSGTNVIAIEAHNDGEAAGLAVRLEINTQPILVSDKKWKLLDKSPAEKWAEIDFDDTKWPLATEENRVGEGAWGDSLQGWPVPLNAIPEYLSHLPIAPVRWAYAGNPDALDWHDAASRMSIERPAGGTDEKTWRLILDFGKELTGRIVTESTTPGLILGTGESTGEVIAKPWTTTSGSASPYTALRYASVTVPSHETRVNLKAHVDHLYYPVRYRGRFDCSDPLLTQVWYTGAYTVHLCMQQEIWDAPKRDRQRWMGDLHVSGEVINNVFADKFLMEQTMTRLRKDAQGGAPFSHLPRQHVNGIPSYSYSWISGLADFYRHLGDQVYLRSQHDALVSMLEFCRQDIDKEGNFQNTHGAWVYIDWSPDFHDDGPLTRATTQFFLFKALNDGVFLLRKLGDESNAQRYAALAQQVSQAAQAHLVSPDGTFSRRKQENAMAIYSGVATPSQRKEIFDAGIFKPEAAPTEPVVSPYYGNYVLNAMGVAGHTQDGLDYIRTFWGQMVKDGATTFYETYDPLWNKHNFHAHLQWDEHDNDAAGYHVSLCHGWSAGPTTFLTEYVLGVQSTGAGFKTCSISPRLGDLSWASGSVPTPNGEIHIRVDRQPTGLVLKAIIPKGTTAVVTFPSSIHEVNGKQGHGASARIGSGTFTITGT